MSTTDVLAKHSIVIYAATPLPGCRHALDAINLDSAAACIRDLVMSLDAARTECDQLRTELASERTVGSALLGGLRDTEATRDAAHAALSGGAAPTEAEVRAHAAAGGRWLLSCEVEAGRRLVYVLDRGWEDALGEVRRPTDGSRWWSLSAEGMPCARPRTT